MKIIDNFLEPIHFDDIKNTLTSLNFPWYYENSSDHGEDDNPQMIHVFYDTFLSHKVNSPTYINLFNPVLEKLKVFSLIRIKANLTFKSNKKSSFHTDYLKVKKCKSAILYLNTNDGGTQFEKDFVKAKENRMVIFSTDKKHRAVRSQKNQGRFVVNINYYEMI